MVEPDSPARLHAIVEGRVQGVGFRYFVLENATELGVVGWVRNTYQEEVEVVAEGKRSALEDLLDILERGPRMAFVTSVRSEWQRATGEFHQFSVERTV